MSVLVALPARGASTDEPRSAPRDETTKRSEADGSTPGGIPPVEIEIRAAPLRHAADAPTVASTVVSGDELRQPGASSADILARVPGVQVNRTGAQSDLATASIRGASSEQVPVYLAGIRLNDDVSGTADLSTIPLFMIDRIEVYRGNAPLKADRLGLGGAIFFWPRLPRETRLGAGAEVGSFGSRAGWLSAEVGNRRAGSLVAVRHSRADNDYPFIDDRGQRFDRQDRRTNRQNADFEQLDAWAVGRYQLDRRVHYTSVVAALAREQGITGLSVIPAESARARTDRLLVGQSLTVPCTNDERCRLEFDNSLLAADVTYTDPRLELPALGASAVDNHGERLVQGLGWRQELTQSWVLHARASVAFENLRIDRAQTSGQRGQRHSLTPALGVEWQANPDWLWHALAGLECHATRGTAVERQEPIMLQQNNCDIGDAVGRVGTSYRLVDRVHLLANVGRYIRVPTLSELYGSSVLSVGNPGLAPERGINADLGINATVASTQQHWLLSFEAFAFARSVDDLIRYRRTSRETTAPFNVAEARILGSEIALALDALDHLRLQGSTTLLDPRETTDDARLNPTTNDILPLMSRLTASAELRLYATPAVEALALSRASAAVRYHHRSARYEDLAGQNVLPAQNYVDLECDAGFFEDVLLARVSLLNVFDARTTDLIGLPAPGRSVHAALQTWF